MPRPLRASGPDVEEAVDHRQAVGLLVGQAGADQPARAAVDRRLAIFDDVGADRLCSTMSAKSLSSISTMPPPGWRARDSGGAADIAPRSSRACRR